MAPSVGEKTDKLRVHLFVIFGFPVFFQILVLCVCVCVCVHAQKFESGWIQGLNLVRGEMGALTILSLRSGLQFGLEVCRKQWIAL